MKRVMCAVTAVLLVASCEVADIETPPVSVISKISGAVRLDVYAQSRSRGNPVPRFRGQDTVQIRTFGKLSDGGTGEITGVPCRLETSLFYADFTTPVNLVTPDYGPSSPALFVQCTHSDGRKASVTRTTINQTAAQRNAQGAGTGILGAIIIGAVNAARVDPAKDEFGYPAIRVNLK